MIFDDESETLITNNAFGALSTGMTGNQPEACLGMLRFTSRKTRDLWTAVGYREDGSRHFFCMAETIGISTVESKSKRK